MSTVKVTVRLAGSCRRVGGVDGHLEQRVRFAGVLFGNAHGYDGISSKVLKTSLPFIISPLIYICNLSLWKGIFPSRLKYSQVIPLKKTKGKESKISNFQPISLLSSLSKIFEKMIYNRLYDHISINNILSQVQFGFRKNLSTEAASSNLINSILHAFNDNLTVGGIFCDLRRLIALITLFCFLN